MSGISEYFHGEGGMATALEWVAGKDFLTYIMSLEGDPHREYAHDYGSDIAIDPLIKPGDEVEYLRLSEYDGIWVRRGHDSRAMLKRAEARIIKNRKHIEEYVELAEDPEFAASWEAGEWLGSLTKKTGVRVRLASSLGAGAGAKREAGDAAPPLSIFFSYSHKNALPARRFFEGLRSEARSDVWLDIARPGESLDHEADISRWLKGAINSTQVFVVLLTREAASSEWVGREINWAAEKAEREAGFHLVALRLDDALPPAPLPRSEYLVDGAGLSDGELFEEIYAAVYKRRGRRQWLKECGEQSLRTAPARAAFARRWHSDYGVAVSLRWTRLGNDVRWVLDYTKDGEALRAEGGRETKVVDFGIRPGDRIGYFVFSHESGITIWMRSDDLSVTPHEVLRAYSEERAAPTRTGRAARVLLIVLGLLLSVVGAGGFAYGMTAYMSALEPREGMSAELQRVLYNSMTGIYALSMLVIGVYQLILNGRPLQFRNRTNAEAIKYLAGSLAAVVAGLIVYPFAIIFGVIVLWIAAAIVFGIIEAATGADLMAFNVYAFLVVYGGFVCHSAYLTWKFWHEKPEYHRSPKYLWWQ